MLERSIEDKNQENPRRITLQTRKDTEKKDRNIDGRRVEKWINFCIEKFEQREKGKEMVIW